MLFQQAFPPALTAASSLTGAVTMTALAVPQFLIVYLLTVPIAAGLNLAVHRRSVRRNEAFRRQVEHFSSQVGEMATLMPITRRAGSGQRYADRWIFLGRLMRGCRCAGYARGIQFEGGHYGRVQAEELEQ